MSKFIINGDVLVKYTADEHTAIVPDTVRKIDPDAFENKKNLEVIIFPESVNEIANGAVYNCKKLKYVGIYSVQTELSTNSFSNCGNFELFAPIGSVARKFADRANGVSVTTNPIPPKEPIVHINPQPQPTLQSTSQPTPQPQPQPQSTSKLPKMIFVPFGSGEIVVYIKTLRKIFLIAVMIIATIAFVVFAGRNLIETEKTTEKEVKRIGYIGAVRVFEGEYEKFGKLCAEVNDNIDYYNNNDFNELEVIKTYESMWGRMSDEAKDIYETLTEKTPPQKYEDVWCDFAECMKELSDNFAKGADLDANNDNEYKGDEIFATVKEICNKHNEIRGEAVELAEELSTLSKQNFWFSGWFWDVFGELSFL